VTGGRKVKISGASDEVSASHQASSNFRKIFSRLPKPRFEIADCTFGGRGGSNEIVDLCKQPRGMVTMTASALTSASLVFTIIWSDRSEMWLTIVER